MSPIIFFAVIIPSSNNNYFFVQISPLKVRMPFCPPLYLFVCFSLPFFFFYKNLSIHFGVCAHSKSCDDRLFGWRTQRNGGVGICTFLSTHPFHSFKQPHFASYFHLFLLTQLYSPPSSLNSCKSC